MKLGTAMMPLSILDNAQNRISRMFELYGRVPFFYCVCHFYLIHTWLVIFFFAFGHGTNDIVNAHFLFRPQTFGFSLPFVYLIWLSVIFALYKPWTAFLKTAMRKRIVTAISEIVELMPHSIHAVTSEGFLLKVLLFFVFAYQLKTII